MPGRPTLLVKLLQNKKFTRGMKFYLVGIAIFLFPAAGSFYSFALEPSPHIPRDQFVLHGADNDVLTRFVRKCEWLFSAGGGSGTVVPVDDVHHQRVLNMVNGISEGNDGLDAVDKSVTVIASSGDACTQCCKGELRFTTGGLDALTDEELATRIAHELAHGALRHKQEQASQFFFISLFGFIMTGLPFLPLMPLGVDASDLAEKISPRNTATVPPASSNTTNTARKAVRSFDMRAFWRRNGLSLALLVPLLVFTYMKNFYPYDMEKEADTVGVLILSGELKEGKKKLSEGEILDGYRL